MIRCYVFRLATMACVAVFACDAEDKGDAAGGCEHAAGQAYPSEEYARQFSPEGLNGVKQAPVEMVPPLSLAPRKKLTREEADAYIAQKTAEAEADVERALA